MFKKVVIALVVLALMIGVFAPLVQHVSQSLVAEKPAVMETAWVAFPVDGYFDPLSPWQPVHTCVGWNS